jgi:hypothetical protein
MHATAWQHGMARHVGIEPAFTPVLYAQNRGALAAHPVLLLRCKPCVSLVLTLHCIRQTHG